MTTTTWQAMEVQPPRDANEVFVWTSGDLPTSICAKSGLYVRKHGNDGWLKYLGPAPHNPGDRIPVPEPVVFAPAYGMYVLKEGRDPVVPPAQLLPHGPCNEVLGAFGMTEQGVFAVRKYRPCLTCVPELREGVWGWATTTTDDERK